MVDIIAGFIPAFYFAGKGGGIYGVHRKQEPGS